MSSLKDLIQASDHLKISSLDNTFSTYKCVAYIHLELYEEAIAHASTNSFEYFYCLYKLKKYRTCARKIQKLPKKEISTGHSLILAQSLYYLKYYNASYKMLSSIKSTNTSVNINLRATLSFIEAAQNSVPHKYRIFSKDNKQEEYNLRKVNLDVAEMVEYEYNESFKYLSSEKIFVEMLKKLSENEQCVMQLNNVLGHYDLIDMNKLSNRQNDVLCVNRDNKMLNGPVHFQESNYEFQVICKVFDKKNKSISREVKNVHGNTELLKIYNVYKNVCKGKLELMKEVIDKIQNKRMRKMLEFLNRKKDVSQEMIRDVLNLVNEDKNA